MNRIGLLLVAASLSLWPRPDNAVDAAPAQAPGGDGPGAIVAASPSARDHDSNPLRRDGTEPGRGAHHGARVTKGKVPNQKAAGAGSTGVAPARPSLAQPAKQSSAPVASNGPKPTLTPAAPPPPPALKLPLTATPMREASVPAQVNRTRTAPASINGNTIASPAKAIAVLNGTSIKRRP